MHIVNLEEHSEVKPLVQEIETAWSAFVEASNLRPPTLGAAKNWIQDMHRRLSWFAVGFESCGDKETLKKLWVLKGNELMSYYDWQRERGQFALDFLDQVRRDICLQLGIEVCDA